MDARWAAGQGQRVRTQRLSASASGDESTRLRESFVLTLKLDAPSFERLEALRRQHFPPALNQIPAHLTLLHRLYALQVGRLLDMRQTLCAEPQIALEFLGLRSLGRGVAVDVRSSGLESLRSALVTLAGGEFSRQDQQRFRPHVTVQNKVSSEEAAQTLTSLAAQFVPWRGAGQALLLWRYLGGPWRLDHELPFARA